MARSYIAGPGGMSICFLVREKPSVVAVGSGIGRARKVFR